MLLPEVYDAIKPALVFFSPKVRSKGEETARRRMPPIIGTGFVVGEGLVVTNDHVVQAFENLPQAEGGQGPPVLANIFHPIEGGLLRLSIEVVASMVIAPDEIGADMYGPVVPDLGIVTINAKGLPHVEVTEDLWPIPEGTRVATAGFPMGADLMVAGEHLTQMAPSLQEGVVSAVTPYRSETARGFVVNITSYGGASGSPVFLTDRPLVVGLLYAGLDFPISVANKEWGTVPTPFTYCAPGTVVSEAIRIARRTSKLALPRSAPTIEQLIAQNRATFERRRREGTEGKLT